MYSLRAKELENDRRSSSIVDMVFLPVMDIILPKEVPLSKEKQKKNFF